MANTYTSAGGTNSAVKDDPNKLKAPNLPYMDPNNPTAIVPLTNSAVTSNAPNIAPAQSQVQPVAPQVQSASTAPVVGLAPAPQPVQQNPDTMRDQAMSTLLTKANASPQTSQVQNLVNEKTTGLLQDPNLGWNGESYKNTQLSNYDKNEAQLFESLRQQFADSADTGQFRKEGLQNQLDSLGKRRTLESGIDYENRDYNQKSLLSALAEGRATETQNQTIQNTPIDNLVKALQAGEGDAQRTADVDTREDVQDYQSQQADLDRKLELAVQNNDIVAQKELTAQKAALDLNSQIQSQGFEGTQAQLTRDLQASLQANDIDATRANLEKQLAMDKYKTDQGTKLTEEQNALNRALEVTLSDMDAETQKAVVTLRGKIDEGMLVKEQDWKSIEADLERKQQEAIANGDWQNALDIENRRGEIQASAQKSQQVYDDAQRIASQSYNTGERLSVQDYQTGLKYLDSELAEAQANNDFGRTKVLEQDKFNFEYNMQNNSFSQEEKMANIAADIEEARASQDFTREKQIMGLQANLEFEKMRTENSYEAAKMNLQAKINEASASKDFEYATQLKAQEISAIAEESAKDRAIELSELALKQDAQKWATYEAMKNAGDPDGAATFLKKELASQGITYNPVDAYAQAKAAIATDFELQKEQYLLTHPSIEGFNEFYNESMFGETSQEDYVDQVVSGQFTYQQMKADPEKMALSIDNAVPWSPASYKEKEGKNINKFSNLPEKNSPITYFGKTLIRVTDPVRQTRFGVDEERFDAVDLVTGKTITIYATMP